jgi:hypothetical protein
MRRPWTAGRCATAMALLLVQESASFMRQLFVPGLPRHHLPGLQPHISQFLPTEGGRRLLHTSNTYIPHARPLSLTVVWAKKRRSKRNSEVIKDPIHANTRVLVVGGGIGGLAAALALARRGFNVKVLEKDESFLARRQGYGLTLQQGGAALSRLGVADAVAAASSWSSSHFVFDSQGALLAFWGPTWKRRAREWGTRSSAQAGEGGVGMETAAFQDADQGQEDGKEEWRKLAGHNLHIPRQALREILLKALEAEQADAVVWGAQVAHVAQVEGGPGPSANSAGGNDDVDWPNSVGVKDEVQVETQELTGRHAVVDLADGRRFVAHCCIACDGIHSTLRRSILTPPPVAHLSALPASIATNRSNLSDRSRRFAAVAAADSGAGGERSGEHLASASGDVEASGLRYLGHMVVLGIFDNAGFPLTKGRAFQMADGKSRMFAMPFTKGQP